MISIIIPVFNSKNSLGKCIDSILSQSYPDYELIIINDGSTDNSLQVCESYAKKDPRIIVLNKTNEGVDKARFEGLRVAKGEYVAFVDSDDWLEKDTLKVMYEHMMKYDVDYVEVSMRRVMDKYKLFQKRCKNAALGLIEQPELFDRYYISFFGYDSLSFSMVGKLYKKSVLDKTNLEPSGLRMGEDQYFNLMLFPHLKSIYISEYVGYNYRYGGLTSGYNPDLYPDLKSLYIKRKELIQEYSYFKANDPLRYEMVDVLMAEIRQKILYKCGPKDIIIDQIHKLLDDSIWEDLKDITDKRYLNQSIPQAILSKDAEMLYSICNQEVNRGYLMWRLKNMAARLCQYI